MPDLTVHSAPRTIRLKGHGTRMEAEANGTIKPGSLLQIQSTGKLVVMPTAALKPGALFALENELIGLGIDDNYVTGDLVQAEAMHAGMWVNALVAAAAPAIVIGDYLEAAADGTLRKVATSATAIAQAMSAVDNSAGGTPARLMAIII